MIPGAGNVLVKALLAGAALFSAAPVLASTGVSIDVSRIDVEEQLQPGGSYRLPVFGVRNPGTEQTRYRVIATAMGDGSASSPEEAWFDFSPAEVVVEPGATKAIHTRLVIPENAAPGRYAALIGPQIVSHGSGAVIGAAAAARLTFIVGRCDDIGCLLGSATGWLAEHREVFLLPALIVALLAIAFVRRRFTVSVVRRT